jgi:hypothetical protein
MHALDDTIYVNDLKTATFKKADGSDFSKIVIPTKFEGMVSDFESLVPILESYSDAFLKQILPKASEYANEKSLDLLVHPHEGFTNCYVEVVRRLYKNDTGLGDYQIGHPFKNHGGFVNGALVSLACTLYLDQNKLRCFLSIMVTPGAVNHSKKLAVSTGKSFTMIIHLPTEHENLTTVKNALDQAASVG